jgi:poly(A)-specific ribonuclease
MQVTLENFEQLLPRIVGDINKADFISFDSEFTGLGSTEPELRTNILDTIQERYEKISQVARQYLPIQIGICTFEFVESGKYYIAKPYNFFVFPRTGNKMFGLDRSFSSQVSSLEFLNGCNFDWATWISKGLPFVNHEDEERILDRLQVMGAVDPPLKEGDTLYEFSLDTM